MTIEVCYLTGRTTNSPHFDTSRPGLYSTYAMTPRSNIIRSVLLVLKPFFSEGKPLSELTVEVRATAIFLRCQALRYRTSIATPLATAVAVDANLDTAY